MTGSFLAEDPIESYIGKRVEVMTPWELISYIKNALKALYNIDRMVEGYPEQAVFKWLQRTYGDVDAGRIVKFVIWRYFGRHDGNYITFTSFAKGRKWWVDQMHAEMQLQVSLENTPRPQPSMAPSTMVSAVSLL